MKKIKILFVCAGNICRSPLAHRLFEKIVGENGYAERFEVDSCGTGGWHEGDNSDSRMRKTAQKKGWTLNKRARQITSRDVEHFDLILAMDEDNLRGIQYRFRNEVLESKLALFRTYDEQATKWNKEVPDPYYGGEDGFERVYDMVERTCRGLLTSLVNANRV